MKTVHSIDYIVSDPAVRSGRPIIAGTSLCVADVAIAMNFHQQDADGIADWFGLTLSQVYAALAYYFDHKADIDADIAARAKRAEEYKEKRGG
jgi:uncharacterized protein (DUF433 family)